MPARLRSSRHVFTAVRLLGWRWFVTRSGIALRRRCGVYERQCPASPASRASLSPALLTINDAPLFASADRRAAGATEFLQWDAAARSPIATAEAVLQGRFRYFGHAEGNLGTEPDWFRNPFTGERAPDDLHWSRIGDFDHGDIKVIWEPSRFGWAYALARAYARTGDARYAAGFWRLFEHWSAANPLHVGANWMCGQEASIRLMAWCFARGAFAGAAASTPARERQLAQSLADSAERIEATLAYAISQRNNHGISEAAALFTAGLLLKAHPRAAKWRSLGRRHLENQVHTLIDADGAFAQHSTNYQRVMLHACLWAISLGERAGAPLSVELRARVGRAADLLYQLQDAASGHVPRYGHNDGALILPLTNTDADDFRAVIQSARFLCYGTRTYEAGPWDEELFWLCGAAALSAPLHAPERTNLAASAGGYYTLRSVSSMAFVRCGAYLHRPGQADMLHVDLRWRGLPLALDAGTYSYNAAAPFDQAFFGAEFHNTVTVDGQQPMDRVGRFLWLPWETGTLQGRTPSPSAGVTALWGERDGYRRLSPPVTHRRALVQLDADSYLIVDRLQSAGRHDYRLHWLLEDYPHEWQAALGRLTLQTPVGVCYVQTGAASTPLRSSLVRADAHSARGWQSRHYLELSPALSLALDTEADATVFWSLFSADDVEREQTASGLLLQSANWTVRLALDGAGDIDVTQPQTQGESLHVVL